MRGPASPADSTQRELIGKFAVRRQFFADADADGGMLIGELHTGHVVRGRVEDADELQSGVTYRFLGRWDEHARFGWQFAFDLYVNHIPLDRDAVIAYLSDHVPRIGIVTAERLWDAYGEQVIEVLINDPLRIALAGIMTIPALAEAGPWITAQAQDAEAKIQLHGLFNRRGFSRKLAAECLKKWGRAAPDRVRQNPFSLLVHRFPFCTFARTDRLYCDLGHRPERLKRQGLCAWDAVRSDRDGHTWLPIDRAIDAVREKIAGAEQRPERAVRLMIRAGWIVCRRDADGRLWVAEADKAKQERNVARKLRELLEGRALWPAGVIYGLSDHQRATLEPLLNSAVMILLGTPGTGKTHTAGALIHSIVTAYGQSSIAVCAPTGKASVRLTENLAKRNLSLTATTIHRMLGCQAGDGWRFAFNEDNPLPYRFVIVDEVSMLDAELAAHLFLACGPGTNVLMVGDPYQLAPVGHGAPLRDFIDASIPNGELTEIQRNSGMIVRACADIKLGRSFETCGAIDLAAGKNLRLVEVNDNEQAITRIKSILDKFKNSASRDVFEDLQVITATRAFRRKLNLEIQSHLNPGGKQVQGRVFRQGDKVICTRNCRLSVAQQVRGGPREEFVANGDLGRVVEIHERSMIVRLKFPERVVRVPLGKVGTKEAEDDGADEKEVNTGCNFDLGYAITGHKFQGSECPVVIVVADKAAWTVASREWWYTSISRAKELCMLIGRQATVEQQCGRVSLRDRKTFLADLLIREPKEATP
jgi:exodeoxyribonuclease V alpha subunit